MHDIRTLLKERLAAEKEITCSVCHTERTHYVYKCICIVHVEYLYTAQRAASG